MAAGSSPKVVDWSHIALLEANAVAVFEVNGGDEKHGGFGKNGASTGSAQTEIKDGETNL
jgi:hypothetical protein